MAIRVSFHYSYSLLTQHEEYINIENVLNTQQTPLLSVIVWAAEI